MLFKARPPPKGLVGVKLGHRRRKRINSRFQLLPICVLTTEDVHEVTETIVEEGNRGDRIWLRTVVQDPLFRITLQRLVCGRLARCRGSSFDEFRSRSISSTEWDRFPRAVANGVNAIWVENRSIQMSVALAGRSERLIPTRGDLCN